VKRPKRPKRIGGRLLSVRNAKKSISDALQLSQIYVLAAWLLVRNVRNCPKRLFRSRVRPSETSGVSKDTGLRTLRTFSREDLQLNGISRFLFRRYIGTAQHKYANQAVGAAELVTRGVEATCQS
jgi:hypothetical protein